MAKEIEAECPGCTDIFDFNTDDFPSEDSGPDIVDIIELRCPHCNHNFAFNIIA